MKEYKFVPKKDVVCITSDLILRENQPSIKGKELKVLTPGTLMKYIGYITDGYNVGGNNSLWYVSEKGDFFWSGNTGVVESHKKLGLYKEKILHSPLKKLLCTQRFGKRPEIYKEWGCPKGHPGVDFRTRKEGDWNNWKQDIFSVLDGKVSMATKDQWNGKIIRIVHDNGYESVYCHLFQINVKKDQIIKAGSKIGISGNSGGASEAPHLHFGYRPIKYDKDNGYKGYIDPTSCFIDEIKFLS